MMHQEEDLQFSDGAARSFGWYESSYEPFRRLPAPPALPKETVGRKDDSKKTPWWLMDGLWSTLEPVVRVLEFGNKKYKTNKNWQKVENGEQRYLDASLRHQLAHRDGELLDPETGLPHLAHAVCGLLFALWFSRNNK